MNVTPALQLVPRKIVYEQPLNERIRTFLRLEFLFNQAQHNMLKDSVWNSRSALISLVDILVILERGDVKTEVLKEMDRHALSLARLARSPGVDQSRLAEILDRVQHLGDRLRPLNGPIGQELKKTSFLKVSPSGQQYPAAPATSTCLDTTFGWSDRRNSARRIWLTG
jgi:Uncharacterized protein conserved in bacteria